MEARRSFLMMMMMMWVDVGRDSQLTEAFARK